MEQDDGMRTYVVTGSASGIGRASAERVEADGHRVIGVDLRDAETPMRERGRVIADDVRSTARAG